jgi:hypothetical protein
MIRFQGVGFFGTTGDEKVGASARTIQGMTISNDTGGFFSRKKAEEL